MQTAAKSNLFLIDYPPSKVLADLHKTNRQGEFYQQITEWLIKGGYTKRGLDRLGQRLIDIAHHAYTLRQIDVVEQASQMLMSLPISGYYRSVGRYYHSFNLRREGRIEETHILLDSLIDKVPPQYRGRVIMSLAGLLFDNGDFQSALPLYLEAGRAGRDRNWCDWFTALTTQRMLAVLKGIDGNHHGALADLDNQLSLTNTIRLWYPLEFYNCLNSFAVELGEVGRLEEANNICSIVLASPLANAYPEWRATSVDLSVRGYHTPRSTLYFAYSKPKNVFHLPERARSDSPIAPEPASRFSKPSGRLLDYVDWKRKMVKEPNGDQNVDITSLDLDRMTEKDMIVKILRLSSQEGLTREQLRDILEHVIKVSKGEE